MVFLLYVRGGSTGDQRTNLPIIYPDGPESAPESTQMDETNITATSEVVIGAQIDCYGLTSSSSASFNVDIISKDEPVKTTRAWTPEIDQLWREMISQLVQMLIKHAQ